MRNTAASAISRGVPNRLRGMRLRAISSIEGSGISRENAPSVGTGPGAMALTRILYAAHSTASDRVRASTPAFAHAEGSTNADPVQAYVVRMLRMAPPFPPSIIRRPKALVQWKEPLRTMSTTALNAFADRSSAAARKLPAALLTRPSAIPTRPATSWTAEKSRTSQTCALALPPALDLRHHLLQ